MEQLMQIGTIDAKSQDSAIAIKEALEKAGFIIVFDEEWAESFYICKKIGVQSDC